MNASRFDALTRRLNAAVSRRGAVIGALTGGLGFAWRDRTAAGPGCKNVGKKCDKDNDCCSGKCKGKKDNKACTAHDAGGCGKNNGVCAGKECTTSAGQAGDCFTTTGKAGYCADDAFCFNCKEDKDCRPFCGKKAACILCDECTPIGGRACAGVGECNAPT